jgi:hypothetical protein
MTTQKLVKTCKQIAEKLNITYHQFEPDDKRYKIDHAFASGIDEIFMCGYTSDSIYLACFFHELGHCLSAQYLEEFDSKYEQEARAWELGLYHMYLHGFKINTEMLMFMSEQLQTYMSK